jgi:hypothetical protein
VGATITSNGQLRGGGGGVASGGGIYMGQ